jgi:ferredoxin
MLVQRLSHRLFHKTTVTGRALSQSLEDHPTLTWLIGKGYSKPIAEGIMKAFPSKPSIGELSSFGESGLKALSDAVTKELKTHAVANIDVTVIVPHARDTLHLKAVESDTFYDLVKKNQELAQYMECACNGIAACSTCHVFLDPAFKSVVPAPEQDELDMIDIAWGSNDDSRLGCQIKLTPAMNGLKVTLPEQSTNFYAR